MNIDPLPHPLAGAPFSLATARAHGLPPNRMRRKDLSVPRYGVRAPASAPDDPLQDLRNYAARMPRGAVFCGTTAARIYGLPLPQPKKPTDYEQFFGISTSPDNPRMLQ